MISLYHICPSKGRAYNSKGELKVLFFYVCTPISMQPDMYIYVLLFFFFFFFLGGGERV